MKKLIFFMTFLIFTRIGMGLGISAAPVGIGNFFLGAPSITESNLNQVLGLLVGADGQPGPAGVSGANGLNGINGLPGVSGAQGLSGAQGNLGTQGITGAGTQGTIGSQGIQGVQGGGVSLQDVEDLIANSALTTTDDLSEGTTNKYFTVARVSYEHIQDVVSNSWVIVHNLGFKPNVTVIDSAGTIYEGEIAYTNTNSLTVSFSAAFSGKAFLS
jgi:hypothetical protein